MPRGDRHIIPLDKLDVSVPEHLAPPGTLRLVKNLCPLGPDPRLSEGARHYWSPVESPTTRTAGGYLGFGRQTRNQFGPLADTTADPNQTLERIVGLTEDELRIIDPGQVTGSAWAEKTIFFFGDANSDRRMQTAQVSESVWCAVSKPATAALRQVEQGDPDVMLEVTDDEVLPMKPPTMPNIGAVGSAVTAGVDGLANGVYLYRYGYILKDGTRLAAERLNYVVQASSAGKITFTVNDGYREALSDAWLEKIKGIAIYLSAGPHGTVTGEEALDAWHRQPVFHVTTLGLDVGDTVEFADNESNIVSFPAYDEDTASFHDIEAATAFSYNGRLWLGDVAYDYGLPDPWHNITDIDRTTLSGANQIRLGVTIKTDKGTFERLGPAAVLTATNPINWLDELASYPDRRATTMSAYISTDSGATWYKSVEHALRPADNLNLAYAYAGQFNGTTNIGTMNDPDEVNATRDRDVNRFLISDVLRPRALSFAREYQASTDPTDIIVGFASNALPTDQGQYGQYPVYALCTESIRSIEVGADGLPQRIAPFTTLHHCVSRYGFCNAGRTIAFAARSGIYALEPGAAEPVRISEPLHYNTITHLDFFACMGPDVALGFYADLSRGREEVWVASGVLVFAYSIRHDRWFLMPRERMCFLDYSGRLLGIDDATASANTIVEEGATRASIAVEIRTARTGLGALGYWKRAHHFTVRQRVSLSTMTWTVSDVDPDGSEITRNTGTQDKAVRDTRQLASGMWLEPSFTLAGTGYPGQALEYIEILAEARMTHRPPETIEHLQAGGANLTITGTPWTCSGGIDDPGGGGGGGDLTESWLYALTETAGLVRLRRLNLSATDLATEPWSDPIAERSKSVGGTPQGLRVDVDDDKVVLWLDQGTPEQWVYTSLIPDASPPVNFTDDGASDNNVGGPFDLDTVAKDNYHSRTPGGNVSVWVRDYPLTSNVQIITTNPLIPRGIAVAPTDGYVFVSDSGGTVERYLLSGGGKQTFSNDDPSNATSEVTMWADETNRLLISSADGGVNMEIWKWDLDGTTPVTKTNIATGLNSARRLTLAIDVNEQLCYYATVASGDDQAQRRSYDGTGAENVGAPLPFGETINSMAIAHLPIST